MKRIWQKQFELLKTRSKIIRQAFLEIIFFTFFYVFMEWVFHVTKPSFMDILTLDVKLRILLLTGFFASLLTLTALLIVTLVDLLLTPLFPSIFRYIYFLPLNFLLTCLGLILLDNFTYTLFGYGVINTGTFQRILYALGFFFTLGYLTRKKALNYPRIATKTTNGISTYSAISLGIVSLVLAGFTFKVSHTPLSPVGQGAHTLPNILLISTDGLSSDNMSVYGYERNTTPFIDQIASISLVSENNFANAGSTTGSQTSTLTGKLPFTTHVLYPPDILRGTDAYQHLPGLLKRIGYRTVSLGVPYYNDANTINFFNAFDEVNCKENANNPSSNFLASFGFNDEAYFLNVILTRISERVQHIFFIQKMSDVLAEVTDIDLFDLKDQGKKKCLLSYLDESYQSTQPLFAHVHLLGTHGSKFYPSIQVFSAGKTQTDDWMTDFYDDSILDFDHWVQQVVEFLEGQNQMDNTLLVIYSDHGQQWKLSSRIPLIIRFPAGQHAGRLDYITQNLDIAPTILDFLGIKQPTWMEGKSLLNQQDPYRLVFAGTTGKTEINDEGRFVLSEEALKPPFYQFSRIAVIQCQNWFALNTDSLKVSQGKVSNFSNPCPSSQLSSKETVLEELAIMLRKNGYKLPEDWLIRSQ